MALVADRRTFLAGLAAGVTAAPAFAAATDATVPLRVSPTRSTTMTTWVPARVRGVVLFSTGHGSWPERYDRIATLWQAAGFAVLAPLHVDSMRYPERDRFTREASFPERLADMRAASAHAAAHFPRKPAVAAGHSFGTLTALCMGGALAGVGSFRDPSVKAVLGYSTPGRIPGLIAPDAYAALGLPTLIVTGSEDVVPGLVTDWHDHLFPIQTAPPHDKYALTLDGARHETIAGEPPAQFAVASQAGTTFLAAYGLGDANARKRLASMTDGAGQHWLRR